MKNFTHTFEEIYLPVKAILLYEHQAKTSYYVESYDMDQHGTPINARPLTIEEAVGLATVLQAENKQYEFLRLTGVLPPEILYLNPSVNDQVIWFTQPQKISLLFHADLTIPNGEAWIPPLLWKASKDSLYLYALNGKKRPTAKTLLFHAPFFNIHEDGLVCMGTVDVAIEDNLTLEEFVNAWQTYFFQSYFSHAIGEISPTKGNIVQLWQQQVSSGQKFPLYQLKKTNQTLKKILPC